ncbi:hypothetical protein BDW75DRAFT_204692 [Aspergillus navahoensis]
MHSISLISCFGRRRLPVENILPTPVTAVTYNFPKSCTYCPLHLPKFRSFSSIYTFFVLACTCATLTTRKL